jgi:hypothetical protein
VYSYLKAGARLEIPAIRMGEIPGLQSRRVPESKAFRGDERGRENA